MTSRSSDRRGAGRRSHTRGRSPRRTWSSPRPGRASSTDGRQESEALWIVPREAVREVHDFPDELNKTYHRVDGYSLKAKLKEST